MLTREKNFVVLHPYCNLLKHEQDLEEFLDRVAAGDFSFHRSRTWTNAWLQERSLKRVERAQMRQAKAMARAAAKATEEAAALAKRVEFRKQRLAGRLRGAAWKRSILADAQKRRDKPSLLRRTKDLG